MVLSLRYSAHSEVGPVRKNNQDSGYASGSMLLVADGMGGAAAGDLASSVAVTRLRALDRDLTAEGHPHHGEDLLTVLAGRVHDANDMLADLVADDPALDGMGTTVTAAAFDGQDFAVVHIGDSRMYRLRDGAFVRVTHDHSWVQSLVDEGRLTPEQAADHPHRSLLLRVLNGAPNNDPDIGVIDAVAGDRLLLCSDGLCGLVDDTNLARMVDLPDREESLRRLVAAAYDAGGSDNITVLLADVVPEPPNDEEPMTIGAAAVTTIPEVSERTQELPIDPAEFAAPVLVDAEGNPIPEDLAHQAQALTQHPHDISPVVAAAPRPEPLTSPHAHAGPPARTRPPVRPGQPARAITSEEDERYAPLPAPPARRRLRTTVTALGLAVVVIAAAAVATWAVWRNSYFIGEAEGQVAVFRGFNAQLGSWRLNRVAQDAGIPVSDLSPRFRDEVEATFPVDSLDSAQASLAELQTNAEYCRRVRSEADAKAQQEYQKRVDEARKKATPSPGASPAANASPSADVSVAPVIPDYGEC